jgi:PilZ domain
VESDHLETDRYTDFAVLRRDPRFKFEVAITIHSHSAGVLEGRTVDISESGIGAMAKVEVPLNEVVRLEFMVPDGLVEVEALVRQQNAFCYGFQFVEQGPPRDLIKRACRKLSMESSSNP